ncbi:hypothetical protein BDV59DRAFT_70263 [Aspergillus ambiguus]|uniref:uncharacterized protein n=1 Tax=Aspergillus ambiguus TaxID=176160 RepID=UPI003CCCACA2
MDPPRNRKQRRAAATASQNDSFDPSSIPMAHPPRSANKDTRTKTLVDIISERQGELLESMDGGSGVKKREPQLVTIDPASGKISGMDAASFDTPSLERMRKEQVTVQESQTTDQEQRDKDTEDDPDAPMPPLIDTILLSVPLTTLHMTLAYLAAHQYAEAIHLDVLLRESAFVAFPVLTLMIHLAHGHIVSFLGGTAQSDALSFFPWSRDKLSLSFLKRLLFPPSLRTMTFLPLAIVLGTKLITITNEEPYYAVMKRAPAIGTLWVWSILEIPVGAAVLGALGPLIWGVWWKGYGIL